MQCKSGNKIKILKQTDKVLYPLLKTLFASFILIHKKHTCCSAMLSKDLFLRFTDTKT